MAEKKTITYDSIVRDIRAKKYHPVYMLMGEEPYYIDRISTMLSETVLSPEEQDFNQTVVFGADVSCAAVIDMAKRYPMMAPYQVIIVKEAQALDSWEPLEKYLDRPMPTTILVFCYKNGKMDRRLKVTQKLETAGVLFESKKVGENDLQTFIEDYLKERGATIDVKARQMMADHVGADLSRMATELDKLLVSLPDTDRRVTPELVEEKIGVSKDFNAFELKEAIVNKDVQKAFRIVKYFNSNPKAGSLYSVLPLLFKFFQNLMVAYYTPGNKTEDAVAAYLGLRGRWMAREYVTGMRNYSGVKTLHIISKMREIDAKSKGLDNPNTPKEELLKELIFFILD